MRICFFQESWERGKKNPLISLPHSFLEIFIVKVTFPGKNKNTTPLLHVNCIIMIICKIAPPIVQDAFKIAKFPSKMLLSTTNP